MGRIFSLHELFAAEEDVKTSNFSGPVFTVGSLGGPSRHFRTVCVAGVHGMQQRFVESLDVQLLGHEAIWLCRLPIFLPGGDRLPGGNRRCRVYLP